MILLLDSTRAQDLRVGIANGALKTLRRHFSQPASSELLRLVDELLKKHQTSVQRMRGIVVATGPGPFSALRTACALANAMSFALRIPAVGVSGEVGPGSAGRGEMTMNQLAEQGRKKLHRAKLGAPVVPFYGKPPNITNPRTIRRVAPRMRGKPKR